MPLNFSLAGKRYDPVTRTVTAAEIEAYAAASADDNPRYRAGPDQVAPPVFSVVPAFSELGRVTADPDLGVDNPLMIVHGEQEFRYHRPITAGEELTFTPSLEAVEDKGSGATFVVKVAVTDAAGRAVVDQFATIFVRGGGSGRRPAGTPPAPAEPAPDEPVATFSRQIAVDMPARYAAASGDHNPIHLDDAVAQAVGLPGVINHGLGTLSVVSAGLVENLAGGDVARLRRLQVRFTDMVFPGSEITTVVRRSGEGTARFETTRPDGSVVLAGTVEVGGG